MLLPRDDVAFVAGEKMRAILDDRSAERVRRIAPTKTAARRRERRDVVQRARACPKNSADPRSVLVPELVTASGDGGERFAEFGRELAGRAPALRGCCRARSPSRTSAPRRATSRSGSRRRRDVVAPVDLSLRTRRDRVAGETGGQRRRARGNRGRRAATRAPAYRRRSAERSIARVRASRRGPVTTSASAVAAYSVKSTVSR